jgi:hypothetical protein
VKKLDFDTVLPGHGEAFTDKAKIDYFQGICAMCGPGQPSEAARPLGGRRQAGRLTKHKEHSPISGSGHSVIAVTRIYELLAQAK